MPILLGIVIPTLLVFSPFIILGLTRLSKPGTNKVQFGIAIMLCFLIGLGVPMMATMISAVGLTYNLALMMQSARWVQPSFLCWAME